MTTNYVPLDFYSAGKSTVYWTKEECEKAEGSAHEFDPKQDDLQVSKFAGGNLVPDGIKVAAEQAKLALRNVRRLRRKAYGPIGDQLDEMATDFDAWKARVAAVKVAHPLP